MKRKTLLKYTVAMVIAINAVSCSTPKNVTYFQDITETVVPVSQTEIKVQPHDRLSIVVKSRIQPCQVYLILRWLPIGLDMKQVQVELAAVCVPILHQEKESPPIPCHLKEQ